MKNGYLLLALMVVSPSAFAQSAPPEPTFYQVAAHRDDYGTVIFLPGDSFMRGAALGFFPDLASPEQKQHPQWEFRSPASTLRKLLPEGYTAVYAGTTGLPSTDLTKTTAENFEAMIAAGIIRDGDVVVLEDAGEHGGNPEEYRLNWTRVVKSFSGARVKVIMMTVPDRIKGDTLGGMSADLFRYSVPFDGVTFNEVISTVAGQSGAHLIEFKSLIDDALDRGEPVLREDGIHPSVEGQNIMVREILSAIGLE